MLNCVYCSEAKNKKDQFVGLQQQQQQQQDLCENGKDL